MAAKCYQLAQSTTCLTTISATFDLDPSLLKFQKLVIPRIWDLRHLQHLVWAF